jgi:two-component system cell cycle response regulator DivK
MPKILIVEDNEDNRDSLSRRLERRGFEVALAGDGKVGVAMVQSERPDLVLMDMNMPELDGWEATRQIKAANDSKNLPVIALTAHAMSGDRDRALEVGCADYHTKPVDFPKLLAQIETILHKGPLPPDTIARHQTHESGQK